MVDPRPDRDSDSGWWDGHGRRRDGGDAAGIASLLVLGLGLASLFDLLPIGPFWAIFAVGFAVVVPLVAILENRLRGRSEDARTESPRPPSDARRSDEESVDAALDRLRDRYARGDLSDEQFESKLEALLETDTPEAARDHLDRPPREREVAEEDASK